MRSQQKKYVMSMGVWEGINPDVFYVTTGDSDLESSIHRFDIRIGKIERLGGGDQSWRAVQVVESEGSLYWGSDSEREKNYVFKLCLETFERSCLGSVDGPVYFCGKTKDCFWFFTAAEDCSANLPTNRASIWKFSGGRLERVVSLQKDWYPNLFMYGFFIPTMSPEALHYLPVKTIGLKAKDYADFNYLASQ